MKTLILRSHWKYFIRGGPGFRPVSWGTAVLFWNGSPFACFVYLCLQAGPKGLWRGMLGKFPVCAKLPMTHSIPLLEWNICCFRIAWVVTYTTRTFWVWRTDVGRLGLNYRILQGLRKKCIAPRKLTWSLIMQCVQRIWAWQFLFKAEPIQISIGDNVIWCHLESPRWRWLWL